MHMYQGWKTFVAELTVLAEYSGNDVAGKKAETWIPRLIVQNVF
jgi:hypothetical protein